MILDDELVMYGHGVLKKMTQQVDIILLVYLQDVFEVSIGEYHQVPNLCNGSVTLL